MEEGRSVYTITGFTSASRAHGASHPEQRNSKLIELRRRAAAVKGAFVAELKTRDDIVIRAEKLRALHGTAVCI